MMMNDADRHRAMAKCKTHQNCVDSGHLWTSCSSSSTASSIEVHHGVSSRAVQAA